MTSDVLDRRPSFTDGFRHEALFYRGLDEFISAVSLFVLDGVAAGEPVLVVIDAAKIDALKEHMGPDADAGICFADICAVGANPARIIPAWRDFLDSHAGGGLRLRGVGEPIGPNRGDAELAECQRHESLLNLAFDGSPDWWLMCPYDTEALPEDVIDEARRSHPFVAERGRHSRSNSYAGLDSSRRPFDHPLADPAVHPIKVDFGASSSMSALRAAVARFADRCGIEGDRLADLVLAVSELATNSLRYGRGRASLRMWNEPDGAVCEVADAGTIAQPLAGRVRPVEGDEGGRGLWLVNQLCDLVQVRSLPTGTVVRAHMWHHA